MSYIHIVVLTAELGNYINSTYRNLRIRISEHSGVSSRTNRQLANPSLSVIGNHVHDEDHRIRDSGFKIVFRARNRLEVRTADTLCVLKDKPELSIKELGVRLHTNSYSLFPRWCYG